MICSRFSLALSLLLKLILTRLSQIRVYLRQSAADFVVCKFALRNSTALNVQKPPTLLVDGLW